MTSGKFATIPTDSITIDRSERQRRVLEKIEELAESISARGLIHPIVVDKNHKLIAGERRLTACISLGWTEISAQFIDDLSDFDRRMIELEENVRRVDLNWQDYVRTVAEIHSLYKEEDASWTVQGTAEIINLSPSRTNQLLVVHRNLGEEIVSNADKLSTAFNAATRLEERKTTAATRTLDHEISAVLGIKPKTDAAGVEIPTRAVTAEILHGDFLAWARTYSGKPFNLIHCDFPYGSNVGHKSGQSAIKSMGGYSDTADDYYKLLNGFVEFMPNFIDPSAHLIFWFSMEYYNVTKEILNGAGFQTSAFPLIWHKSDNAGILPDPNRGPRRTYETALFASLGDRKIVRAVANSYAGATTKEFHPSEKPRAVLTHFFRMVTDSTTRLLDPTAGSGNAVRAVSELGAEYSLGIERDGIFAESAKNNIGTGTS